MWRLPITNLYLDSKPGWGPPGIWVGKPILPIPSPQWDWHGIVMGLATAMGPAWYLTGLAHAQANRTVPTVAHANPTWDWTGLAIWVVGVIPKEWSANPSFSMTTAKMLRDAFLRHTLKFCSRSRFFSNWNTVLLFRWNPGLLRRCRLETGGTILCCELAMERGLACSTGTVMYTRCSVNLLHLMSKVKVM